MPMKGLADEQIKTRQKELEESVKKYIPNSEIIDTYINEDAPKSSQPGLWYLGRSFELLSQADMAVFALGWEQARGCWLEYAACKHYDIPVKFEVPDLRE